MNINFFTVVNLDQLNNDRKLVMIHYKQTFISIIEIQDLLTINEGEIKKLK